MSQGTIVETRRGSSVVRGMLGGLGIWAVSLAVWLGIQAIQANSPGLAGNQVMEGLESLFGAMAGSAGLLFGALNGGVVPEMLSSPVAMLGASAVLWMILGALFGAMFGSSSDYTATTYTTRRY